MTATASQTAMEHGAPYPLGARLLSGGVNFAVASIHATAVTLELFDAGGKRCIARHQLHRTGAVFHGLVTGLTQGAIYGLRAQGPYAPEQGHRFNPAKLLIDPYATEVVGDYAWHHELYGYERGHPAGHRSLSHTDSAARIPKVRVAAPLPELKPDATDAWRHPGSKTIIYELHVAGFSRLNNAIPEQQRGTYSGLAHPASIAHLRRLAVTTLCLLPVAWCIDEAMLPARGLTNHWGYNPLAMMVLSPRYSMTPDDTTATRREFRAMVAALHDAGLEVVLDVVFNHTAEGNELGPTLSMRGLDNATWYLAAQDDPAHCENLTGCGNTLNIAHPRVTQYVLDTLRFWVTQYGVDGFRFDLASVLGRTPQGFDTRAAFFTALLQDPILAQIKLIAEPWDIGNGGYQLGHFPEPFLEWNDKFRDSMRRFWLQGTVGRGEFARRLMASSDVFDRGNRTPCASVNYISAHDGFTLHDMVSYKHKHNNANGEDNRDGRDEEPANNCGVEGPSADPQVIALRQQLQRTLLGTLLLSRGTPMLRAGDEVGQTQQGNNNVYCQDNALSWIDWQSADEALIEITRKAILLRNAWPQIGADSWPTDTQTAWLDVSARALSTDHWHDPNHRSLAVLIKSAAENGSAVWMAFNAGQRSENFQLPHGNWTLLLDSALRDHGADSGPIRSQTTVLPHSMLVLGALA